MTVSFQSQARTYPRALASDVRANYVLPRSDASWEQSAAPVEPDSVAIDDGHVSFGGRAGRISTDPQNLQLIAVGQNPRGGTPSIQQDHILAQQEESLRTADARQQDGAQLDCFQRPGELVEQK